MKRRVDADEVVNQELHSQWKHDQVAPQPDLGGPLDKCVGVLSFLTDHAVPFDGTISFTRSFKGFDAYLWPFFLPLPATILLQKQACPNASLTLAFGKVGRIAEIGRDS